MVLAIIRLSDIERLPVELFGLIVITQVGLNRSKACEIFGDQRMPRAVELTMHLKRPAV